MKTIFTILILISNLTLYSQENKAVGDYLLSIKTNESDLKEWKLTLNENGTFFFHYYSNVKFEIPSERNIYGKGKWTMKNNVISFYSDKQKDLDEKHTLNFNNSKARFVIKSPRDKTDKIVKTRLHFLESEIFWMKGTELFKI
ncbi:hypothetical protein FEDK69T_08820 [Flavobacterium enshiense DK69]|uniref:Uncharacterized protein n=1 Tax=Flavobacterium enshiense DK69 TaxID=1107311 RepID=V6SJ31_9FLAO|nr:hypothetical protein [Flavobacterium enshiense]ESU24435.1 hypothetical protein FEDK69T_08820 [Flavobacterium enshiense DK69]KGO94541.1 hypothetical protein Q767_13310 [Flavobacterium enshiense DK69]